jgi:basic membrane protein A and related proteins
MQRQLVLYFIAVTLAVGIQCLPSQSTFRISVMYANGIGDFGWTYAHELARSYAETRLLADGYQVRFSIHPYVTYENATALALAQIADDGVDMFVLTSAGYYEETIHRIYEAAPHIPVLSLSTERTASSVNLFPRSYQAYYLAGYYCGLTTVTGNIGHLGIVPIQVSASEVNAFFIGAKTANPNVNVKYGFMDVFFDPVLERVAATHIADNWDIDCAVSQSLDANNVWASRNIVVVGHTSDMRYQVGENVHFSTLYQWNSEYYTHIRNAILGNFTGGAFVYKGIGDMLTLSQFSTLVSPERRTELVQVASNVTNLPMFCPPFYDRCLNDFEISMMAQVLPSVSNPRNFSMTDFVTSYVVEFHSTSGIIISLLASIGIGLAITLAVLTAIHSEKKVIIAASPLFCYMVIAGCILAFSSTFFWMGVPTALSCQLQLWIVSLGYSFAFGSLMIKNARISYLFNKAGLTIVKLDNKDLLLRGWLPVVFVELACLTLWVSLDAYLPVTIADSPYLASTEQYLTCASQQVWGVAVFLSLKATLLIIGLVISHKIRKVKSKIHNEANAIRLTIYNSVLLFALALFVLLTVPTNVTIGVTIICIAIILIAYGMLLILFAPKFVRIYKHGDISESTPPAESTVTSVTSVA